MSETTKGICPNCEQVVSGPCTGEGCPLTPTPPHAAPDHGQAVDELVEAWKRELIYDLGGDQMRPMVEVDENRLVALLTTAARRALAASPSGGRDWTEDSSHENGQYQCRCVRCGELFTGHKRRVVCRLCATQPSVEARGEAVAWLCVEIGAPNAIARAVHQGLAYATMDECARQVRYFNEKSQDYTLCPLYTHPAPSGGEDAWEPSGTDYDRAIHHNPDAKAWADLFVQTFPRLADKHDLMLGWFANAMMAMHDSMKSRESAAPRPETEEGT